MFALCPSTSCGFVNWIIALNNPESRDDSERRIFFAAGPVLGLALLGALKILTINLVVGALCPRMSEMGHKPTSSVIAN